jgi:hypothetical protein
LRRILDDNEIMLASEIRNLVHIGGLPIEMHRYDGSGA